MQVEEALSCPACRARFRGTRECSRCGANLDTLMALAAEAYTLRQAARRALRARDVAEARDLAERAQCLCAGPKGRRLLLLTSWLVSCR